MADARRTRDYDPELMFLNDPSYTPLDQIGTSGGGLSAEGLSLPGATAPLDNRVQPMDFSDLGLQTGSSLLPQYANRDDDAFKGPGEQLMSGLGQIGSALGNDIRDGFNAITPDQNTVDNIAMRFQRAHAIGQGTLPYYLQEQMARQQMGQHGDVLAMKRQALQQQLEQRQQLMQQRHEDQALKIWGDHQMPIAMKKKMSQQLAMNGNVLAGNLARLGDEQLVAEMDTLAPFLPKGKMDELGQLMTKPNADLSHVEQWLDHAREKKKASGQQRMESERFTDLLGRFNGGELDESGADFDELKQMVMNREKKQQESTELRMKLEQMGLTKRKAEQEFAASSVMPQYGPEVHLPGGFVQRDKFDPRTGQLSTVEGNKPPTSQVNVNTVAPASVEAQKRFMDKAAENYDRLRNVPDALKNIEEAKLLIPSAKNFMGPAGETLLEGAKFLNNRLGMQLDTKGVKSAEELRSRIFFNIMDNLKKLDAQPSQQQQQVMQDSLGKLGTDPKAMSSILDAYGDSLRRKVDLHNKEIESSEKRGVQFPFDAKVKLDPKAGSKLQQEFVETRVTKDGRKLGKTKDGKIVEIK